MTDIASALAVEPGSLGTFEGVPVLRAAIEIPNAAGGLREAMQFEPRAFAHDEEGTIVLRFRTKKVRFDEIKDKNDPDRLLGLVRVHVLDALEATFIEDEAVDRALAEQRDRIERAKEAAAGTQRIPFDDELVREHELGEHADELIDGCPECDRERASQEAGD